jgi:hypothetical protein
VPSWSLVLPGQFPFGCAYDIPIFPACDAALTPLVEQERILRDKRGFELDQCPAGNGTGDDDGIKFDSGALKQAVILSFFTIAAAMVWM